MNNKTLDILKTLFKAETKNLTKVRIQIYDSNLYI